MLTGAIALTLLSLNVHALSVGKMNIESYLGEPLDISIDVNSVSKSELSTLDVSLASPALFTQAGIQYPDNAKNIHVDLDTSNEDNAKILVTSTNSVSDPFVHLLLKISWSGGNMLREYTALIDPSDYKAQPIVKAAAPASSLGVVKSVSPATTTVAASAAGSAQHHKPVVEGDSLSAIAALYRPADVSIQQAWMAFYNLNPDAFPDNNLNKITKGARLRIPSVAEMKATPKDQALSQVKQLTRPLKATPDKPAKMAPVEETTAPTLVVGGASTAKTPVQTAETKQVEPAAPATQALAMSDLQGYDQFASVVTEMGQFTQTVKQEMNNTREQNKLFKEELIASRGETQVLANRMANLESQLGKMSQLLEMQSQALQALNAKAIADIKQDSTVQLTAVDAPVPDAATAVPAQAEAIPAPAVEPVAAQPTAVTPETETKDKTYYEQLLEGAITDASEEDQRYIEEIVGQSSTSMGMPDDNPVTPEMQIAAAKPDRPEMPADQETEMMLKNVRASLGNLQAIGADGAATTPASTPGVSSTPDLSNIELKIADKDVAYIEALNEDDRGEIQKSEKRIAELERQLQEKIAAAQSPQAAQAPQAPAAAPASNQSSTAAPATATRVAPPADQGFMGSLKEMVMGITSGASGISSEIWKLMAGAGIGILVLMGFLGFRNRREELSDDTDILPGQMSDMSTTTGSTSQAELDDLSDFGMRNVPDDADMDIELHGSSMFDLSDESFMASEAIQDDSSLFSMDDDNSDMESLGEMDSTMMGGNDQSTLTSVDVDPIAEAEVYLAYDRKEQAIEVLEQSLQQNSNQPVVVTKLLGLYQSTENKDNFTELFEASAGNVEDDAEWDKIKRMAKEVVPDHHLLADDFDSSIPVLMDELVDSDGDVLELNEASEKETEEEEAEDLFAVAAANLEKLDAESGDDEADSAADSDMKTDGLSLSFSDEPLNLDMQMEDEGSLPVEFETELDEAMEEVDQHDPETALALAKAYIDLGENDIAKDFLNDVIRDGADEVKANAEKILASMG